jgi:hypothetical protein
MFFSFFRVERVTNAFVLNLRSLRTKADLKVLNAKDIQD